MIRPRTLALTLLVLAVVTLLVSLVLLGTLGVAPRARRKARIYSALLVWHLRGCPDGAGLRFARPTP